MSKIVLLLRVSLLFFSLRVAEYFMLSVTLGRAQEFMVSSALLLLVALSHKNVVSCFGFILLLERDSWCDFFYLSVVCKALWRFIIFFNLHLVALNNNLHTYTIQRKTIIGSWSTSPACMRSLPQLSAQPLAT